MALGNGCLGGAGGKLADCHELCLDSFPAAGRCVGCWGVWSSAGQRLGGTQGSKTLLHWLVVVLVVVYVVAGGVAVAWGACSASCFPG